MSTRILLALSEHPEAAKDLVFYLLLCSVFYAYLMLSAKPDPHEENEARRQRWMEGHDPDGKPLAPDLAEVFKTKK